MGLLLLNCYTYISNCWHNNNIRIGFIERDISSQKKCSSSVRLAGFFIQLANSLLRRNKILSRATISYFLFFFIIVSSIVCAIVDWRLIIIIIKNGKWEILYFEFVCRCDAEIKMYVSGCSVLCYRKNLGEHGSVWLGFVETKTNLSLMSVLRGPLGQRMIVKSLFSLLISRLLLFVLVLGDSWWEWLMADEQNE